jgi:hypothetical protein
MPFLLQRAGCYRRWQSADHAIHGHGHTGGACVDQAKPIKAAITTMEEEYDWSRGWELCYQKHNRENRWR